MTSGKRLNLAMEAADRGNPRLIVIYSLRSLVLKAFLLEMNYSASGAFISKVFLYPKTQCNELVSYQGAQGFYKIALCLL